MNFGGFVWFFQRYYPYISAVFVFGFRFLNIQLYHEGAFAYSSLAV
jgi:hypothetical protein